MVKSYSWPRKIITGCAAECGERGAGYKMIARKHGKRGKKKHFNDEARKVVRWRGDGGEGGRASGEKEGELRSGDVQLQNILSQNELSPVPPFPGDLWFTPAAFD